MPMVCLLKKQLKSQELHEDAIIRLEEAVERYPNSSQTVNSRYMIAESYRALAIYPKIRLDTHDPNRT